MLRPKEPKQAPECWPGSVVEVLSEVHRTQSGENLLLGDHGRGERPSRVGWYKPASADPPTHPHCADIHATQARTRRPLDPPTVPSPWQQGLSCSSISTMVPGRSSHMGSMQRLGGGTCPAARWGATKAARPRVSSRMEVRTSSMSATEGCARAGGARGREEGPGR